MTFRSRTAGIVMFSMKIESIHTGRRVDRAPCACSSPNAGKRGRTGVMVIIALTIMGLEAPPLMMKNSLVHWRCQSLEAP